APNLFMEFAVSENVIAGNAMLRRAQYQFGPFIPRGARGQVDCGLGKSMAAGNYAPGFELTMALKDVRLMLATAGDAPLSSLPGIAARMETLIAQGHGHDDLAALGRDAIIPRTSPPR
ncbi:MAG TPA: hypothetical protein PLJ23_10435, partial [Gemmatimonadales bacterium]|nr:hypothetical protein [Gemmatimonadales bacterium]